jgi:CRP/FNR family transcriptional regulator
MNFAQAVRRSRILAIPKGTFLKAIRSSPPLYELTKRIGLRLIRCQSRVEDLVFCRASTRLARLVLRLIEDFGKPTDRGLAIELSLTEQEMATLIGATRQTVSLALREMIQAGIVLRRPGTFLVTNERALRAIADLPAAGRRGRR